MKIDNILCFTIHNYNPHDLTALHFDISSFVFGVVLAQRKSNLKLHPIFYFLKRITPAESKHYSFELEILAIIYTLKRLRIYLKIYLYFAQFICIKYYSSISSFDCTESNVF